MATPDTTRLWSDVKDLDKAQARQATVVAVHEERIEGTETRVDKLAATVDKLIWIFVGLAVTIASSSVIVALTVASSGHS